MCHIPPNLSIQELSYVELLTDIDPTIKTLELLAILDEVLHEKDKYHDTLSKDLH